MSADYLSFTFNIHETGLQELVLAALDGIGFEGFEEKKETLIAFIPEESFDEFRFQEAIQPFMNAPGFSYSRSIVAGRNWNELWEKSFQPVTIASEIVVRASFHPPVTGIRYDIVIDPKMSFGTGHHATTGMMLQLMLQQDFNNKQVLDFGSGTGILSILAAKTGAAAILAIDHEEWACNNAAENFALNGVTSAIAVRGDSAAFSGMHFDLILANINRTIIVETMPQFRLSLSKSGKLLISGFLTSDEDRIIKAAESSGFQVTAKLQQDDWIAMSLNVR